MRTTESWFKSIFSKVGHHSECDFEQPEVKNLRVESTLIRVGDPYLAVATVNVLSIARIGKMFQKSILAVVMIIVLPSHETGTSLM